MKKIFAIMVAALVCAAAFAQSDNSVADSILGEYQSVQGKDSYKVRVTKNSDGTYKAQIFWLKEALEKDGSRKLDTKNPDKSLRNVPCDQIVLFNGLKYNAEKKQWDGTKIYDPQRGLKAVATCSFDAEGRFKVKGSFGPFSDTAIWTRLK